MKEIDPEKTKRAEAFKLWIHAPQPMVTLIKKFNVQNLVELSEENGFKFNMLLCYCIGKAAMEIEEFYLLPQNGKLFQFDKLAIDVIVKTKEESIQFCDIPFSEDITKFNEEYLRRTKEVYYSGVTSDLSHDYSVIGTSTVTDIYLDGIINMYSGIFNNPFLAWGKYKKRKKKYKLPISFQFHHSQMDGEEAGQFLNKLKQTIKHLKIDKD